MIDVHDWEADLTDAQAVDLAAFDKVLATMRRKGIVNLDDPRFRWLFTGENLELTVVVQRAIDAFEQQGLKGFGILRRLRVGLRSVIDRADGNVVWDWHRDQSARQLSVLANSDSGYFRARRWELNGTVTWEVDEYRRPILTPSRAGTLTVWPNESGPETQFLGNALSVFAAQQWMAYQGRCALRGD